MGKKSNMSNQLGWASVWTLAAGGMVGGGIYIALGVVVAVAAQWAWLSFIIAGLVGLSSAHSYVFLTNKFEKGGGAFSFLEELKDRNVAGSLSWVLMLGYVLTMAVYAYAFGHYLAYAFNVGPWLTRIFGIGIIGGLVALNLMGIGKMTKVEIAIVSANLAILLILGIYGIVQWDATELIAGIAPRKSWSAIIGAASIFMAYEGFQLLTYEYEDIKKPKIYLKPVLLSAVVLVIAVYVLVALGATSLAGALTVIDNKQIALSIAALEAFGQPGLILLTIAAGFATAAAVNSTLFSTAKLAEKVADTGELPAWFEKENDNGLPARALIFLGTLSAGLAVIGTLSTLVEAASLAFLYTFGTVNYLAYKEMDTRKWIPVTGIGIASIIAIALLIRLSIIAPLSLIIMLLLGVLIILGRPFILKKTNTDA